MRCEKERDAALLALQEVSSQPLVLWHRVVHSACEKGEMVMSMEPMISVDGIGGFKHADMFLITEKGNEPLTRFRNDVIVID